MRRTSHRSVLGVCAGVAGCFALAACGGGDKKGGSPKPRTVDRARATGERPTAKAAGSVRHPQAVAIRISSAPKQRVTVVWALSCTTGDKEKTSGGSYSVIAPNIRQLALPAGASGQVCALDSTAKILTGRIKVTLLANAPDPRSG